MGCNLCRGSGSIICMWPLEWWRCPKCSGNGATVQFGPATIGPRQSPPPTETSQ